MAEDIYTATAQGRHHRPAVPSEGDERKIRYWREDAACRDADPELFFVQNHGDERVRIAVAKSWCASCEVRAECLADGYASRDQDGIRGGLTAVERARGVRFPYGERRRAITPVDSPVDVLRRLPCGTHAAFNRHRAAREIPCDECVIAERTYQRERGRRRRALSTDPATARYSTTGDRRRTESSSGPEVMAS